MNTVEIYEEGRIVGRVEYNNNLDFLHETNYQHGGLGMHLGFEKIKDGRYVLIYGTQWHDKKDYAEVATLEDVANAIVRAGKEELFEEEQYADLKATAEKMGILKKLD